MKTTKRIIKEIEIIDQVYCNKCGKSCTHNETHHGLIEARVMGGYDSPGFFDQDEYIFSLCESCLLELFTCFKHPPPKFNKLDVTRCSDNDVDDDRENNGEE